MDPRLLELLVCPLCKGPLDLQREPPELICKADRLAFALRDGMADMLEANARPLDGPAPAAQDTAA